MTSYDAIDHGATAQQNGQAKKPWVTPSLQMIALKSAQHGGQTQTGDGHGGKFQKPKS